MHDYYQKLLSNTLFNKLDSLHNCLNLTHIVALVLLACINVAIDSYNASATLIVLRKADKWATHKVATCLPQATQLGGVFAAKVVRTECSHIIVHHCCHIRAFAWASHIVPAHLVARFNQTVAGKRKSVGVVVVIYKDALADYDAYLKLQPESLQKDSIEAMENGMIDIMILWENLDYNRLTLKDSNDNIRNKQRVLSKKVDSKR